MFRVMIVLGLLVLVPAALVFWRLRSVGREGFHRRQGQGDTIIGQSLKTEHDVSACHEETTTRP